MFRSSSRFYQLALRISLLKLGSSLVSAISACSARPFFRRERAGVGTEVRVWSAGTKRSLGRKSKRGKFLAERQRTRREENTKHVDGNVDQSRSGSCGVRLGHKLCHSLPTVLSLLLGELGVLCESSVPSCR